MALLESLMKLKAKLLKNIHVDVCYKQFVKKTDLLMFQKWNKDAVKIPSPKFTCGFGNYYYLTIAGVTTTVINVL